MTAKLKLLIRVVTDWLNAKTEALLRVLLGVPCAQCGTVLRREELHRQRMSSMTSVLLCRSCYYDLRKFDTRVSMKR